jgi:hypothetical protein
MGMANNNNIQLASSPETMSKRAAIDEAAARVGPLFEVAKGRWSYHVWSPKDEGWIPALRADGYGEARRKRTSTIAAMATDLLLREGANLPEEVALQIITLAYRTDNTGSVSDRVNWILDRLH